MRFFLKCFLEMSEAQQWTDYNISKLKPKISREESCRSIQPQNAGHLVYMAKIRPLGIGRDQFNFSNSLLLPLPFLPGFSEREVATLLYKVRPLCSPTLFLVSLFNNILFFCFWCKESLYTWPWCLRRCFPCLIYLGSIFLGGESIVFYFAFDFDVIEYLL